MSDKTDTRTATQKIEDLEKVSTLLWQQTAQIKSAVENLLRAQGDMALVKEALKLLNKKSEAIVQAALPETGITPASVSALVTKMNVDDLTAQVAGYLASGHLAASDAVAADSYLVCEEYDSEGNLANPRIQFRLDSQDEKTQAALTGKKAGDTVSFGEGKLSAKILEIYTLTEPKAPEAAPAADAAPAATETASTEAAPATDATPAPAEAPATPAATGPSNDALAAPAESPVTEFVPSQPGAMTTAS